MSEVIGRLLAFGGPVLPWIFVLSFAMWVLILRALIEHRRLGRVTRIHLPAEARALVGLRPGIQRRVAQQRASEIIVVARRHLPLIRTFVQVLPLLGLLGTVSGLIHCFDGIALFGEENHGAIATGVSEALVATLGGLLAALSGLAGSALLEAGVVRLRVLAEQTMACRS